MRLLAPSPGIEVPSRREAPGERDRRALRPVEPDGGHRPAIVRHVGVRGAGVQCDQGQGRELRHPETTDWTVFDWTVL